MSEFMPTRLLVTGAAGFIGSNFIHWMQGSGSQRGALKKIVILDALTYAGNLLSLDGLGVDTSADSRLQFVRGDVCDSALMAAMFREHAFDAVVHLAAESHVDRSIEDGAAFVRTNVLGTFTLLDVARRAWKENDSPHRFLLVSTDEVYGALGEQGTFTEDSPYAPNSPYAASKAAADHFARAAFKTYGLPVITTNCSNNYGPRQFPEKLIPLMIANAVRGEGLPVYGQGKQVRDWLHVDDHCSGIWSALMRGIAGERYLFGGGAELPNLEVVQLIADLVDEALTRDQGTSRRLIKFVPDRLGHDFRYAIDASKAIRDLGWRPTRTFEDGIRATVQWYLDNKAWVEATRSGEYLRFYDANYAARVDGSASDRQS
jgi:dTDP-glucose 4,6-dehydratase